MSSLLVTPSQAERCPGGYASYFCDSPFATVTIRTKSSIPSDRFLLAGTIMLSDHSPRRVVVLFWRKRSSRNPSLDAGRKEYSSRSPCERSIDERNDAHVTVEIATWRNSIKYPVLVHVMYLYLARNPDSLRMKVGRPSNASSIRLHAAFFSV